MIKKQTFLEEISKIKFLNDITENTVLATGKLILEANLKSWGLTEFDNKNELMPLRKIAGMSTAANAKIINLITKSMTSDETYVNIGVYHGYSLIAGMINTVCKVDGVDNFSQFENPKDIFYKNYKNFERSNTIFYDMDYKDYLKGKKETIDFYFYDGPHDYKDQYNAIDLAKHLLKSKTIVMIDDSNLEEVKNGTFDALRDNNIDYDIWLNIETAHNKHPTYWNGLIVLEIK